MQELTNPTGEPSIESLWVQIEDFSKTTIELSKLKAIDVAAQIVSLLVAQAIAVVVLILFIFILDMGVALWIGDLLGKIYYGFFIVAGFNAVVGIILLFFLDKWIKVPVTKLIITEALK